MQSVGQCSVPLFTLSYYKLNLVDDIASENKHIELKIFDLDMTF